MSTGLGYRTKADLVYERLRERVITGELQPGDRVPMIRIAQEFGVSTIPVREGVKRLEAEGLLRFEPHKGAVVPLLDAAEVEETFAIRAELEGLAVRRAAAVATPELLATLRGLLDQMADAASEGRADDYGRLNREFHMTIYRAQPFTRLTSMIEALWDATDWCRRIFVRDAESIRASAAEHQAIVDALARGDGDAADHHLHAQKQRSSDWIVARLHRGEESS